MTRKLCYLACLLFIALVIAGCGSQQTQTHSGKVSPPVDSPQSTARETSPQVETPKPATMPDVTFSGKVIGVTDGDTIKVLRDRQPVNMSNHTRFTAYNHNQERSRGKGVWSL